MRNKVYVTTEYEPPKVTKPKKIKETPEELEKRLRRLADEWIEWMRSNDSYTSIDRFLIEKGIYNDTHLKYILEYDFWREAHDIVRQIQKIRIIEGCLKNRMNPWFGAKLLAVQHGMRDLLINESKVSVEKTTDEEKASLPDLLKKLKEYDEVYAKYKELEPMDLKMLPSNLEGEKVNGTDDTKDLPNNGEAK
ncbi:MAG: hypothetical protein KKF27_21505 [Gammaproteobacteria bacterium]|nr:hypothetical protein [Gammaproteobacteria bacterium]